MKYRFVVVAGLVAAPAFAQQRDTAGAQAMFDQAREAMKAGDLAKACPKFAESHRLDPQPGTLANLALCEEKQGKIASAWTHARDAAEQLGAGDDRVPALRALVTRVEKRLPRLVVKLAPGAPKNTVVTRDGIELGQPSLGEPMPVDPGEHVVAASAPHRQTTRITLSITEGATKQLDVSPGDPEEASPDTPKPAITSDRPPSAAPAKTTVAYVAGGIGVVGAVVALGTGIVLSGKQSTVKASCDTDAKVCRGAGAEEARDAASSGKTLLPVFYGGLVVGVVGLGTGGYLLLSSKGDRGTSLRVGPGSVAVGGKF